MLDSRVEVFKFFSLRAVVVECFDASPVLLESSFGGTFRLIRLNSIGTPLTQLGTFPGAVVGDLFSASNTSHCMRRHQEEPHL